MSEEVAENITKNGLRAQIFEFFETVETVLKASQLMKESSDKIVKTLLVEVGSKEYLALMVRGDRKVDYNKLNAYLGCEARLANADDVLKILKVPIGAVSPLLNGILRMRKIVDPRILEKEYVVCGGGSLRTLVKIDTEDLMRFLSNPEVVDVFK